MKIGTLTPHRHHRQFSQNFQISAKHSYALNNTLNNALMGDTVSFGKKPKETTPEGAEPETEKGKGKKKKHHFAPKALLALITAYTVFAAVKGTQYMTDEVQKIIEAHEAMRDFKENPAEVAEAFIEDFALDKAFTSEDGSTTYTYTSHPGSEADNLSHYSRINSSITFTYDSEDGLKAAALDLDSDDNPEIIVKPAEEGYKVFYDLNSDGKIDFVSAEEGQLE